MSPVRAQTPWPGVEPSTIGPAAAADAGMATPCSTGQMAAHSPTLSSPNTAQPAAAGHCSATMALADSPVSTMPSPGPQKINPPSAGWPSATSRSMHHTETFKNTSALATPAANRSAGQVPGSGNAMPSVSSTVAASPQRASRAACHRCRARGATQGSAMQASAPIRYPR